jgi:hypothetical protein
MSIGPHPREGDAEAGKGSGGRQSDLLKQLEAGEQALPSPADPDFFVAFPARAVDRDCNCSDPSLDDRSRLGGGQSEQIGLDPDSGNPMLAADSDDFLEMWMQKRFSGAAEGYCVGAREQLGGDMPKRRQHHLTVRTRVEIEGFESKLVGSGEVTHRASEVAPACEIKDEFEATPVHEPVSGF